MKKTELFTTEGTEDTEMSWNGETRKEQIERGNGYRAYPDSHFPISSVSSVYSVVILLVTFLAVAGCAMPQAAKAPDPHYTEAGFFDLYYCHWTDRPLFVRVVFTSTRFTDVTGVEVFDPKGRPFASVDLNNYGVMKKKSLDDPEKRGYFQDHPYKGNELPGWYSAKITLRDGRVIEARDRVEWRPLEFSKNLRAETREGRTVLRWDPPTRASHYKVYVRDPWQDNKMVIESPLLDNAVFEIPAGTLEPGGEYVWAVHARDAHHDPEWGDFNAGSTSAPVALAVPRT